MRTIMDLKQLRYFMAIVEERQITAAARRLHIYSISLLWPRQAR